LPNLKHTYDLSDEAVCERWLENPYWQFFTGEVVFQTCVPCDPSSLTRWRQRLGEAGMEALLAHTINTAHAMKAVRELDSKLGGYSKSGGRRIRRRPD
ncbi:transposase, partial [Xanthomonas oryzae pv. oryzae]